MDSRRCLIIFSITPRTAASSSSMRSSTSRCLIAARRRRMVESRADSFARMAAFMSSVIRVLRLSAGFLDSVHLLRQHLAAQTLVMALHCGGELALALGGRLLVVLAGAQLREETRLLHGPLEAPHGDFERLVFLDSYCRHPALGSLGGRIVSKSSECSSSESRLRAMKPASRSSMVGRGDYSLTRSIRRSRCTRPTAGWCRSSPRAITSSAWCP